jgi:hypothetical protein
MSLSTYYGPNTIVGESCVWVADSDRRVCITYDYNTTTGELRYAASIFKCLTVVLEDQRIHIEPTDDQMVENSETTERRFEIRPVCIVATPSLSYNDIISTIRRKMCNGYGCKGPRGISFDQHEIDQEYSDHGRESSENSFLSDTEPTSLEKFRDCLYSDSRPEWTKKSSNITRPIGSYIIMNYYGKTWICTVSSENGVTDNTSGTIFSSLNMWTAYIVKIVDETHIDMTSIMSNNLKKIRYITTEDNDTYHCVCRYQAENNENYKGVNINIMREFFITFKANKHTGELIYGAAISRLPIEMGPITDKTLIDGLYNTALVRLEKKPVAMCISEEFRQQINSKTSQRENMMYEIIKNITSRKGGRFVIKKL